MPFLESFQVVNQTEGPPSRGCTKVYAYDGSNNLIYQGFTPSQGKLTEVTVANGGLTSIVVLTNVATVNWTAHGLEVGHIVRVYNALDAELNDEFVIATVPNANSFTFATSGVADATYNGVSLRIETNAPRQKDPVWTIKKFEYNGSNYITAEKWANGLSQTNNLIWDDRATYGYL